jgi:hypothetical protein
MSDANYVILATSNFTPGTNNLGYCGGNATGTNGSKTTTACGVAVLNSAAALYDPNNVYVAIHN